MADSTFSYTVECDLQEIAKRILEDCGPREISNFVRKICYFSTDDLIQDMIFNILQEYRFAAHRDKEKMVKTLEAELADMRAQLEEDKKLQEKLQETLRVSSLAIKI